MASRTPMPWPAATFRFPYGSPRPSHTRHTLAVRLLTPCTPPSLLQVLPRSIAACDGAARAAVRAADGRAESGQPSAR